MFKTRFEWMGLLMIAALLGTTWIFVSRTPPQIVSGPITLTEAPIVGHLAPDFTLQTPVGESITLSEVIDRNGAAGQPVVLNFWASWCGPCRVEMPDLQRTSMKYNGRSAIIGINQGESAATVTEFGNEFNITYPLLVDDDNTVNHLYTVSSLPTTVFINASGVVHEVQIGILTQAVLEDRIEELLKESNP
ncbi:MAG: TlpA family protein disulfide reductase [Chloroflexi bacterium]|nr:MAG: TlpA family protein disulfide reductase [Chloroflexota bacterium]